MTGSRRTLASYVRGELGTEGQRFLRGDAFLSHLKQKAGLSPNYWSDKIHFSRYHTEVF